MLGGLELARVSEEDHGADPIWKFLCCSFRREMKERQVIAEQAKKGLVGIRVRVEEVRKTRVEGHTRG